MTTDDDNRTLYKIEVMVNRYRQICSQQVIDLVLVAIFKQLVNSYEQMSTKLCGLFI